MNGNSPPTLHKQFNTVHFIQVYIATQGLNLGLLPCRQILYHLSHQGNQALKHDIKC